MTSGSSCSEGEIDLLRPCGAEDSAEEDSAEEDSAKENDAEEHSAEEDSAEEDSAEEDAAKENSAEGHSAEDDPAEEDHPVTMAGNCRIAPNPAMQRFFGRFFSILYRAAQGINENQ